MMGFWQFRENITADLLAGECKADIQSIHKHAVEVGGINTAVAAEYTERLFNMINRDLLRKVSK